MTSPETVRSFARSHWKEHPLYSLAVNICENCGETAERLTMVSELDYLACDDCYEEAMRVSIPARKLYGKAGLSQREMAAFEEFTKEA